MIGPSPVENVSYHQQMVWERGRGRAIEDGARISYELRRGLQIILLNLHPALGANRNRSAGELWRTLQNSGARTERG
ncbi:hypothetical protein NDU88_004786 [Pleurodeles waltl]|uniref:Uncharacterized protein n=1 Tax=Pleurodeles waltl TaxID=8319 RepID=A0AAV7UHZ8_PLEWA|nr:hypothetical protein NDU88_004786 [Pleurodeles waltl]